MNNSCKVRKLANTTLVVGFVFAIVLPIIDVFFELDPTPRNDPQVALKIDPSPKGLLRMPGKLKYWFENNFGFRELLLQAHGRLKFQLYGVSPSEKVLPGRKPWLFLRSEQALDMYCNLYPFSDEELRTWVSFLDQNRQKCLKAKASYFFVIAPSKPTIYGEYLPPGWRKYRPYSRLDQLNETLATQLPQLNTIDLRPVLRKMSKHHRVYYYTDTHWNELGAYSASRAIQKELYSCYPEIGIQEKTEKIKTWTGPHAGDLARMMGLKYVLHEEQMRPLLPDIEITREDGNQLDLEVLDGDPFRRLVTICASAPLESAIVFHDSFGKTMVPYLARIFRRTVFIWNRQLDVALIEQERPQVVLHEIVERRLLNWMPDDLI